MPPTQCGGRPSLTVLQPILDPTFSYHSYGFRPGRSAHDAVLAAQSFVQSGRRIVVDVDLEKFFDRVDHDILIDRLRKKIPDPAVIRLVRAYLNADIVDGDTVIKRNRGTPQGGPVSPLLANLLLDEVDKDLERRGHAFCRYADDCNVYLRSRRAGEWVPALLRRLYDRLHLRAIQLKQWRRGETIFRELTALGAKPETARIVAANSRRWWRNSGMLLNAVLTIKWADRLGMPRLA